MSWNRENLKTQMMDWRHQLHRNPELGFEEKDTAALVAKTLRELGLDVYEGVGHTGVVATLKQGNSDRSIGIRADMDALLIQEQNTFDHASTVPGKMHACGHDGHTSMLLGAASVLSQFDQFDGTIHFIFQPAEEHGRGALAMMEDSLFDRFPCDAIYALHNMPSLEAGHVAIHPGGVMASEDNFEIILKGKGGHAALPHLAKDPVPVCGEIIQTLQTIVSRKVKATESAVVSITSIETDGTRNVIPNQITLTGDTRSFSPEVQKVIETEMERIIAGACQAHGIEYEFTYSYEFASTINTVPEAEIVREAASTVLDASSIQFGGDPIMASEDFGFMLQKKPGCYFLLGNGGTGPGGCGLHSPHYDFNDEILLTGVDLWVALAATALPKQS